MRIAAARTSSRPSRFSLAKPLTLDVGASFERFDQRGSWRGTEAADAIFTTLRYHRQLEGADIQQDFDADMSLQAATRALNSDFVYSMRTAGLRYQFRHGKHLDR